MAKLSVSDSETRGGTLEEQGTRRLQNSVDTVHWILSTGSFEVRT